MLTVMPVRTSLVSLFLPCLSRNAAYQGRFPCMRRGRTPSRGSSRPSRRRCSAARTPCRTAPRGSPKQRAELFKFGRTSVEVLFVGVIRHVPMISWRRRYWPDWIQLGIVKDTLPLFAMSLSTAHVWSDGVRPSSWILNHCKPVTSLWVASGIFALRDVRRYNISVSVAWIPGCTHR